VARGRTIFVPDQLAQHVFLIHEGVVGLMTGQLCGAEAIVVKHEGRIPIRDHYARTYTPTTMCRMTMAEFERTVQTDPALSLRIVQLMAERVHDLRQLLGSRIRTSPISPAATVRP
jgi:CRP-like cAMP-binding protein